MKNYIVSLCMATLAAAFFALEEFFPNPCTRSTSFLQVNRTAIITLSPFTTASSNFGLAPGYSYNFRTISIGTLAIKALISFAISL